MKKIIAAATAAVLMLTSCVFTAYADENLSFSFEEKSVDVQQGDEFEVNIDVNTNTYGFNNATFVVRYDPSVIIAQPLDGMAEGIMTYGEYNKPFVSYKTINSQINQVPSEGDASYGGRADGVKSAAEIGIVKIPALIQDYTFVDGGNALLSIQGAGRVFALKFKAVGSGTTDISIDPFRSSSFVGGFREYNVDGFSVSVAVGGGSSSSDDETTQETSAADDTEKATEESSKATTEKTTEETTEDLTITTQAFSDISVFPWASEHILKLSSKFIISGYADNTFRPAENVKRADFIVMLMKAVGIDTSAPIADNFDDVNSSAYYAAAVGTAKALGIASGSGDGTFSPSSNITRQDMMMLAKKALEYKLGEPITGDVSVLEGFADNADISPYAREALAAMVSQGIISGTGSGISPKTFTTRAQAAVVISKIYDMAN